MKIGDSQVFPPGFRRALRFYMTNPSPCPYIEGQQERKAFTNLQIAEPDKVHDMLSKTGFRRSQAIAYRPACPTCNACRSVRVNVRGFAHTKKWRRINARNSELVRSPVRAEATREQFALLKTYLQNRHDGAGMSEMSYRDYASMVNQSPVQSLVFEYREGSDAKAPLVAVAITDVLRDGFSMVYTFFASDDARRSIGSYMILDHIEHARELGLPHVYLGYWIKGSDKMEYKRRFTPMDVLDGDIWRPLTDQD